MEKEIEYINIRGNVVEIDKECVDLVNYFNSIGLDTKFSCSGHGLSSFEITFNDNILDVDIEGFVVKFDKHFTHSPFVGRFLKWMRKVDGEIKCNWSYIATNIRDAERDYETFTK